MSKNDLQSSGISLLKRAVELDSREQFEEAVVCYQEGIGFLIDASKKIEEPEKKKHYREKIVGYLERVEFLKNSIRSRREAVKVHQQLRIERNSTSHGYESVFKDYLNKTVTRIRIEDPYIRSNHQIYNLLRFCELCLKYCENLQIIDLITTLDDGQKGTEQQSKIEDLRKSLQGFSVTMNVQYSVSMHDREIRLSNGWIIKIGRGLDYFQPPAGRFSIGFSDLDFRPCHETTVDIFHESYVASSND